MMRTSSNAQIGWTKLDTGHCIRAQSACPVRTLGLTLKMPVMRTLSVFAAQPMYINKLTNIFIIYMREVVSQHCPDVQVVQVPSKLITCDFGAEQ